MFRTGIRRPEDYPPPARGLRSSLIRGCISYELLAAVHSGGREHTQLFEAIVRDLRISLGICRTTARGRFRNLDPEVNGYLKERSDPARELVLHDWAASDCLTSSEWAQSVFQLFPRARFIASDLMLFLVEATLPAGDVLILEPSGGAVQYIRGPFVTYLDRPEGKTLLVNRILAAHANRILRRDRAMFLEAIAALGEAESGQHGSLRLRRLPLVHPDAEHLARTDTRFSIVSHSAFEALSEPADVIRAMNIFNPGYFGPEMLRSGRDAVWASLKPGGAWIVGRTSPDGSHRASLFEKTSTGFRPGRHFAEGSEIADLVLERP